MAVIFTLTKEEAKNCKVTITNIETDEESYYYDYKGMVLIPNQVKIKENEPKEINDGI